MTTARAMTLLELLVAMTIMIAIVGLTSALWAQASGWAADESLHRQTLRLEHVRSLFAHQWQERRPGVRIEDPDGPAHRLVDEAFEFVTSAPVLFPDAALVRATYRVEPTEDATLTNPRRRLVYEERRVVTPTHSESRLRDATGRPMLERLVLLEDCATLVWRHYAPVIVNDAFGDGEASDIPVYEWREATPEPVEETTGAPARADDENEDRTTGGSGGPTALRLQGAFQETPFQWTLALGPSR